MTTEILRPGASINLQAHRTTCVVERRLGEGGQGEVYEVVTGAAGDLRRHALKWYFPAWATRSQWDSLQELIRLDPPSKQFLWPEDIAVSEAGGFGYLMPLRGPEFKGLVELMHQSITPSFRALATAAYQLADGFHRLHSIGLCYRDISFGNVFLDEATGNVLICDNDNVGIDGEAAAGVLGTTGFMAPEVVRGEALPTSTTDLYSLSVLLFLLFMVSHPLLGRRETGGQITDPHADKQLYGDQPVFIWDPADDTNRPDPDVHRNAIVYWGLYPKALRDLFTQAFTAGLRDPQNGRVRETQWRDLALDLRDVIHYCPGCGNENFWDRADPAGTRCWRCGTTIAPPPRLVTRRGVVLLNHDTKLYPHHIGETRRDFARPLAEVVRHPSRPGVTGLRNLDANRHWRADTGAGSSFAVPPGRSCTLAAGTTVDFGPVQAVIEV
ncbi:protein kinase [Actinoplanes sp. TBRC 11911]|uniref:protein kinase domain-containing protein n=1 Tax=Actinoplanes sp. TBRC 11911 TaxID=2729386 RepID=UPI00145DC14D|nr:protein kinase [Actinoplanes sp. TBRC 11911]NMO54286.1 protein kinase [Actinoplanes sp. TBRC 11911]